MRYLVAILSLLLLSSCEDDGKQYDLEAFEPIPLDSIQAAPQPVTKSFQISPPFINGKACPEYKMEIHLTIKNDSVRSYRVITTCK